MARRWGVHLIWIGSIVIAACQYPASEEVRETVAPPASTTSPTSLPADPTPAPSPTLTEAPPAPDLDAVPLYWFGPLPPMAVNEGRPFIGSEDFMDLFDASASWEMAEGRIQVFKLYGEWVAYNATDAELRQAVEDIRRRGLALAVEAGPLNATSECGADVEGFAGIEEGLLIASRIQKAGGRLHLIALDEPFFFAHFYDGPNACHWPAEQIAAGVGAYIEVMREALPDVIIGDTEPLAGVSTIPDYQAWLETFRAVNGYDLAFLHLDIDWSRPAWSDEVKQMEAYGQEHSIPVGLIYNGDFFSPNDESWLTAAGERVRQHELVNGGAPEHVLFQSWNDHPDFVLPETESFTFTGFIQTYFTNPEGLGFRREGAGANLALEKLVRISAGEAGHDGYMAVDGEPGTWWSAGAPPVQWIEVDLGSPAVIAEIRLLPSQYPSGRTIHRVYGRGSGTGDEYTLLHAFDGITEDGQLLSYAPVEPWVDIQYLQIETRSSPSWVAWREIEVIAGR